MLQFSDAHGLNSPCVDRTDNGIDLLKIGQPDIQLLTYQKFLSSLAPIIPYFLCTDSIIRYSDFAQTPTQILFNHSQWHFRPKIFFFIRFTCVLFLPILLNLNQKMYFIRNDFNLRRTCHFNIFPITFLSIDNHTPCKQNKS